MNFSEAVQQTQEIAACLKPGLQALGADSKKIKVTETTTLKGSVNIDTCLKKRYPNAPRWDYVFGYENRVYYVEVHQAKESEVRSIIAKFEWVRNWCKATPLEELQERSSYHWVSKKQTATFQHKSSYRRRLAQRGIYGPSSVLAPDRVP